MDELGESARPEGRSNFLKFIHPRSSNNDDDGITVYLRVNYKVILLVVVIFDVLHTSINEIVNRIF